jgi:type II secretory pathway pseudopilin PulG
MRRHKEAGEVSLIALLFVMMIMLVLAGALMPSIFKMQKITNESGAAQFLSTLNSTELVSATAYGMYLPPKALVGSLALPLSCSNPMLITGQMSQAPEGYVETFTGSGAPTAPASSCAGVTGYSSFSVALDPISTLSASRHYFLSSTDGLIHEDDANRPATIADPALPVSSINLATFQYQAFSSGTGGTGTTTPIDPAGTFSGTMTLQANGGCNYNGLWAPYGTSQTVTTGTLTLDAFGNVTSSSFPNGVSFGLLNNGIPASQFAWYAGQPNDTGIGGNNITTLQINTATDGSVTFSGNSLATFSSGYQSFSWVGGLTSSEPGCQQGTGGLQITISMHQ